MFLFTFFSLLPIFSLHWWPLALSPRLINFHFDVVPPTKKCLLCFLSLALDLCRPFFRWVSLVYRFFSVFLLLYSPNFLDMTINPSLILFRKRGYSGNNFRFLPLSGFVFSLAASPLQDAGGYAISRQNNLELHLSCHTCWLSYLTLVCLWCGRTVGRTVTWLPNFLGWVDYHIFLPMVLRYARESSSINNFSSERVDSKGLYGRWRPLPSVPIDPHHLTPPTSRFMHTKTPMWTKFALQM